MPTLNIVFLSLAVSQLLVLAIYSLPVSPEDQPLDYYLAA